MAVNRTYTAPVKAKLKAEAVGLRAQAYEWSEVSKALGIPLRTLQDWRQKDEAFALECADADRQRTGFLVTKVSQLIDDPKTPARDKLIGLFFLIKQADPSFRENHKVEHTVSPGLAGTLKAFAKLGRGA